MPVIREADGAQTLESVQPLSDTLISHSQTSLKARIGCILLCDKSYMKPVSLVGLLVRANGYIITGSRSCCLPCDHFLFYVSPNDRLIVTELIYVHSIPPYSMSKSTRS